MQAYDDARDDAVLWVLAEDAFASSRAAFAALTATLASAEAGGWTHDQLEDHLETDGRELLRLLFQEHLDLRALREQHAVTQGASIPVVDADGACHRKVGQGHVRRLATVSGTVRLTRCAWRADGARNLCPADAALNLPCRLHSHTLRRRAAVEAARGSFGAVQQALTRSCGKVAGKRQVEQLTVAAASDIDAFYHAQVPQPATDDTLLVCSVDGKGVVMRPEALREPTRKAAAVKGANRYRTRLASGEKQGRKRMATLGTVYDADPAPRRPHDVMTPAITLHAGSDGDGGRRRRTGPVATAKWPGRVDCHHPPAGHQRGVRPRRPARPDPPAHLGRAGRRRPPPAGADPRRSRPPQGDHPHPGRLPSTFWSICGRRPGASTRTPTPPPSPGSPATPQDPGRRR
jgi:hypothetical protein